MEAPTNRLLSRVTEVKMAGFWPSSLPHFYGPKESLGQHTGIMIEYAWAIKDQIIWPKLKKKTFKTFLRGNNAGNPERAICAGKIGPFCQLG